VGERMKGKVVVVVGAGSIGEGWGNGKAASVLYAREGAKVFACDMNLKAAETTRDLIRAEGNVCQAYQCDATDVEQVEKMVAECVRQFGAIHVLHNNIGISEMGGPVELSEDVWDRVMNVNLKSFFFTCKHCLPVIEKNPRDEDGQRGAVVNIASIAGIRWSGVSYISYSTSKGALIPFTRSVALEYASRGIRANCVLPGLMNTPMVHQAHVVSSYAESPEAMRAKRDAQCPTGKMGDAWDTAHAALFLASNEAKYVNGTQIIVDGGLTAAFA
jgi:NAD(P)-dependent dehydrogenase (short-subunit alcohol dehydrogenase family)